MTAIDLAYFAFVLGYLISFFVSYHLGAKRIETNKKLFPYLFHTALFNFVVNVLLVVIWFFYSFQKDPLLFFGGATLAIFLIILSQLLLTVFLYKKSKDVVSNTPI
ncbi:hypothetical protein AJ85_04210 [Alkalihalobacillus alcalophilus ATCC 27647 = CGMCC 1.3604]|uniref:Uncharacterized protein n=1 Tax=Alkalihalobacillus alcalophilus ATCC 27647 = CGMCC 1.3604 TaxID=1218173 RepID=A0A094XHU8_ALKAL|nr:hypothetical protein [Alkalihalobacillus alcalophilus]KGA98350.1 hypothetical protein BALCAV_0204515 [Alkalihalobacillus alcalophilus ATCC 27647 = CGMCC 1.3604]MED1563650.1 hypothetical protein [Alkalihalobacillus alcalophilus]THG91636.1 hypothetical protein AJ85_04210 [Alkalihalobacillus alcalophilus ATCC 27647 = CGMCC 1.3604]